jgi:hypothetical protein
MHPGRARSVARAAAPARPVSRPGAVRERYLPGDAPVSGPGE